jgi:hypothetical protein
VSTDAREMTDRELYDQAGLRAEWEAKYGKSLSPREYAWVHRTAQRIVASSGFNGSTKFINAMLSILVILVAGAITGEVIVYGQVQAIQAQVNLIVMGRVK